MKKILVVEDAQSLRKDILEMLGFEGFEAVGAENGLAGVEKAREIHPDLIICDIMMPGMDGYGVLETLRRDPATATIPFIFLTARTDRVDIRQGMELGADDYLTKPFTAAELLATVHARLEKRAQIAEVTERKLEDLRGNIMLALPHEMRTPLNVILGFSDILMTDASVMEAERIEEMARHINNAGMRLYRLIENCLVYAHTEIVETDEHQKKLMRETFTLSPKVAIEGYANAKAQTLGTHDLLVLDIQDAPAIGILEDYLKKIIEELLDNAFKFSEKSKPVTLTGRVEDSTYTLHFTDHGRGMTPEQIANVGAYMQFDRRLFEQQGAGLGLVICRRLAELHGGSLNIHSQPGRGTEVVVRFPIRHDIPTEETDHAF